MAIVTSSIVEDAVQVDGRRAIAERHVDHLSVAHFRRYLALAGDNVVARLTTSATQLATDLAAAEIQQDIAYIMLGQYARVTAQHASLADVRAAVRALYQTGSGEIIGRLAGFLLTLTDAQLQTLFAMNASQVTALKTRLNAKVTALNSVLTAVGE